MPSESLYADFIKTMMAHRRLFDLFVFLVVVATGKLHYQQNFLLIVSYITRANYTTTI